MRKKNSRLLPIIGLLLIIVLGASSFVFINNPELNLDLRRQASGQQLEVTVNNSSTKIQPNQAFTVDLMLNTQGKFVSGVQFSGKISGVNQDDSGVVLSQVAGLNAIFSEVTKVGSDLQFKFVELANLGGNAYTTHDQNVKLATFNLYPLKSGEVKIAFDQNNSGAMEFGQSFLTSSIGDKSYNIEISSNIGGGGSSAPPDGGIHRSCNEYCADSRECATEYSCWYNRCRNPKNLTEEKCTDPVVVVAKPVVKTTTTNTQTPKGGTVASPSPTPVTATATVIISKATSSAKPTTGVGSFGLGTVATASPRVSPTASPTTRSLGGSPSPVPTVTPKTQSQGGSNLGLLIGAAVVTGLLAFGAIIFFLKNRNNNQQSM